MAKTIITQSGDLVNYANIIAVFVDDELDDDENVLGYNLLGLDVAESTILLGEYDTLDEGQILRAFGSLPAKALHPW